MSASRVAFYIDGYNLYHAIHDLQRPHLKWVNYRQFAENLVLPDEVVEHVYYFSALATHLSDPGPVQRHRIYMRALESVGVECVLGKFKQKWVYCPLCRQDMRRNEEKESDVNIAIYIVRDALLGKFDRIYLVTGDSDLAPAVRMIKSVAPHIEVISVAPPGRRHQSAITDSADRLVAINASDIEGSLFPARVTISSGKVITRPPSYDPPI